MKLTKAIKLYLALLAVFLTFLLMAELTGAKLIQFKLFSWQWTLTLGVIPFPVTFVITDILNEFSAIIESVNDDPSFVNKVGNVLWKHYKYSLAANPYLKEYGWLSSLDSYRYIRQMYMHERILIVSGDMLKGKTMRSIARSAKKMQIPIRVYYPSNVEMFWEFNKVYRENIMDLPFDDKTIIISTVANSWHRKGYTGGYWHYLVRGGVYFQRRLLDPKFVSIKQLQVNRYISKENGDLSIIGVPSAASFP